MKISKIQKGLIAVSIAAASLALGCELIVDFDRTKIPVEGADTAPPPGEGGAGEGGANDAAAPDGSADAADQ